MGIEYILFQAISHKIRYIRPPVPGPVQERVGGKGYITPEVNRYVHLNPVKAGLAALPERYPWSSMKVYTGEGADSSLVYRDTILGYFNQDVEAAEESYRRFVHAKLVEEDSLEELVTYDDILGSNSFVSEVRALYTVGKTKRNCGSVQL